MRLIFSIILIILISCDEQKKDKSETIPTSYTKKIDIDSLKNRLNENIHFIVDSLLKRKDFLLIGYIKKYQPDSCGIIVYNDSDLRSGFEGFKNVGDINSDKINDTVFIIPPFNYCEEGYSYLFFDTSLPRLLTDSYCCHPDNLFSTGDIDEDGISEICIFYSSCVSRFKALIVYSLKNNKWKEIGSCGFDINFMKLPKEKRIRKISKGKFEMLEIIDKEENKEWKQFIF